MHYGRCYLVVGLLFGVLLGCGSDSGTLSSVVSGRISQTTSAGEFALVRFLNTDSQSIAVNFSVDNSVVATGVEYTSPSEYLAVPSGTRNISVLADGDLEPLTAAPFELIGGQNYTFVSGDRDSIGSGLVYNSTLLDDYPAPVAESESQVRFLNSSHSIPQMTLEIGSLGAPQPELRLELSLGQVSQYFALRSDSEWSITVRDTGSGRLVFSRDYLPCYEAESCTVALFDPNSTFQDYAVVVLPDLGVSPETDATDESEDSLDT